ncbi:hypothetical protein K8369_18005, partial [Streptomyces sp. PSKA30]|nr:hypothetical protein [Streptomyces sp. PSKA30]
MPRFTRAVGTATRATRVDRLEVGLRRSPRRRSATGASSMTQKSESTTSTQESDDPAATSPFAPPVPPLAEPRPLAERRVWPRTFHDRLTAPLPG